MPRAGGPFYMAVNRAMRERGNATPGSTVTVELERDDEPRVLEPPPDLAEALASSGAAAAFEALSHSHRKEYVDWIDEAKREETRRRRIEKAAAMLREGKKLR